jgi:hypothetical protein
LTEIAGRRGDIDGRTVGNFLSKHEGRIEGGLRFKRAGTDHKVALWAVETAGEPRKGG